jgi:chromosome segregation ATPase
MQVVINGNGQKLEDAERTLLELESKLSSIVSELGVTSERAAAAENQVASLESLLSAERNSLEDTRRQLVDASNRVTDASAALEALRSDSDVNREALSQQCGSLAAELRNVVEERDQLIARATQSEQKILELETAIRSCQVEFDAALSLKMREIGEIENRLSHATQELQEAQGRARIADSRISTLENEVAAMKALSSGNDEQYLQQCADLDSKLKAALIDAESAKSHAAEAELRIQRLEVDLETINAASSRQIAASETECADLHAQLAQAQLSTAASSERALALERRVEELEAELSRVKSEASDQGAEMDALHTQVESRLTDALRDLECVESKLILSEERCEQLRRDLRDAQASLSNQRNESAQVLAGRDEKINNLEEEVEALRRKTMELEMSKSQSSEDAESLRSRIIELELEIKSMSSELKANGEVYFRKEEEMSQIDEERQVLANKVVQLESALHNSASQLSSVQATVLVLQNNHKITVEGLEARVAECGKIIEDLKLRLSELQRDASPTVTTEAVPVAVVTSESDSDNYRAKLEHELQNAFEELNIRNEEIRILKAEISSSVSAKVSRFVL